MEGDGHEFEREGPGVVAGDIRKLAESSGPVGR